MLQRCWIVKWGRLAVKGGGGGTYNVCLRLVTAGSNGRSPAEGNTRLLLGVQSCLHRQDVVVSVHVRSAFEPILNIMTGLSGKLSQVGIRLLYRWGSVACEMGRRQRRGVLRAGLLHP